MPTISYDGQSFILDGRRVWLVSGAIHYARIARGLWRDRIRAAKQAGLNCIETYVFWNVHEPRPGVFNFEGDADLRAFVKLVIEEGLYCIVRPGPYICAEWDFGGMPAWLNRVEGIKLREANGPFLEACSRYLGAVMEQIKDLQLNINSPGREAPTVVFAPTPAAPKKSRSKKGKNAPAPPPTPAAPVPPPPPPAGIIMIQAENEWICHNPEQGEKYLREIVRYLRENGCTVPINVCNNLWQSVDGAIDTWNSNQHLAFDLRQLRVVQPNAPRMVTEFWPGWFDQFNGPHHRDFNADWNLYRLAQILATGSQYNLYMFHGGTNFGFYGGRTIAGPDCFMTTSYDYDAPLREAGGRGVKYLAVKRISTFASQFGHVFAHLEDPEPHTTIAPDDEKHPLAVIHQSGPQGDVVFLIKSREDNTEWTHLMLPNGLKLPVALGDDRVAWLLLNANLGGVAELTYTNLRPFAFAHRKLLVMFGVPGNTGLFAIDDTPHQVAVPLEGEPPAIERSDDVTIVVLNRSQVDATYITPKGIVVGAAGLNEKDEPIAHPDWSTIWEINPDGLVNKVASKVDRVSSAPKLDGWSQTNTDSLTDGTSDAYKPIEGPASLETLKQDFGYGWYRVSLKSAKVGKLWAPESGDRLHVFRAGKRDAVLGLGVGAEYDPVSLRLSGDAVVLADNMGRFNFGWSVGESKGLFGHIHDVKPIKLGKPDVVDSQSPDPFALRGFVLYTRRNDHRPAEALVWQFKANGKRPVFIDIQGLNTKAMIFLNHKPIGLYDRAFSAGIARFTLNSERGLRAGKNELRFALFNKADGRLDAEKHVTLYESAEAVTDGAAWAFAPWSVPAAEAFGDLKRTSGAPTWYRAAFRVKHTSEPLWLEPDGMSKGQLYLNGRNIGRFWVATDSGKEVPPQSRYYLPEPWLKLDEPNELVIFDEHGKAPRGCRLVYDRMGPYGE